MKPLKSRISNAFTLAVLAAALCAPVDSLQADETSRFPSKKRGELESTIPVGHPLREDGRPTPENPPCEQDPDLSLVSRCHRFRPEVLRTFTTCNLEGRREVSEFKDEILAVYGKKLDRDETLLATQPLHADEISRVPNVELGEKGSSIPVAHPVLEKGADPKALHLMPVQCSSDPDVSALTRCHRYTPEEDPRAYYSGAAYCDQDKQLEFLKVLEGLVGKTIELNDKRRDENYSAFMRTAFGILGAGCHHEDYRYRNSIWNNYRPDPYYDERSLGSYVHSLRELTENPHTDLIEVRFRILNPRLVELSYKHAGSYSFQKPQQVWFALADNGFLSGGEYCDRGIYPAKCEKTEYKTKGPLACDREAQKRLLNHLARSVGKKISDFRELMTIAQGLMRANCHQERFGVVEPSSHHGFEYTTQTLFSDSKLSELFTRNYRWNYDRLEMEDVALTVISPRVVDFTYRLPKRAEDGLRVRFRFILDDDGFLAGAEEVQRFNESYSIRDTYTLKWFVSETRNNPGEIYSIIQSLKDQASARKSAAKKDLR